MKKKKFLFTALLAAMLVGCASHDEVSRDVGSSGSSNPAEAGSTPVGFNAYTYRSVTRSGNTGVVTIDTLKKAENEGGGFGVFAYYTDLKKYDQTYIPNFMYNQGVFASGDNWEYTPVMYWPNEYGSDAKSDDQDKVSFFAYAPYVKAESPAAGSVADATYGITGFSRNTTAGDPVVKYIASFSPAKSVDLCWGVCDETSWAKIQEAGSQTMTKGLPWLNVEHPQGIDQKLKFTFRHALSQLNVQIDADPDIITHDEATTIKDGTKVYVRSISFTGIALQGALNLNNSVANTAQWLDYSGSTDLPYGESVTVKDGRRDGREGAAGAEATNEVPTGLNAQIIQNSDETTGVTNLLQNLFQPTTVFADPANPTVDELAKALAEPVYVIPTGEAMTVTIVYDVETVNPNLSGYISDGATHGVSIENRISKTVTFGGIEGAGLTSGKKYTLKLHLGMNSVKFNAEVGSWDDSPVNGEAWLPDNNPPSGGTGEIDPNLPLSMSGSPLAGTLSLPFVAGSPAPVTITATPSPDAAVYWQIANEEVASISTPSGTRGMTRGASGILSGSSIKVTPVAAGSTTLTCWSENNDTSTVAITVYAASVALSETSITNFYIGDVDKTLTPSVVPAEDTYTFTSSNTNVATVGETTGVVHAVAAGNATITCTTSSGATATCTVQVKAPTITLNKTAMFLKTSGSPTSETLTATVAPNTRSVTWSVTSGSEYASVNGSGVVTAKAAGTATIRASIVGQSTYYAECTVTVYASDPGVALSTATSSDVGKAVTSDGKIYANNGSAGIYNKTVVGVLAYSGSTGHGLICALVNATNQTWNTINGWNDQTTQGFTGKLLPDDAARGTLTSYTTLGGTTVSNWMVLSMNDYKTMWTAFGGADTYNATSNGYITDAGGTACSGDYWSTSEYTGSYRHAWNFDSGGWYGNFKTDSYGVRPVLAF